MWSIIVIKIKLKVRIKSSSWQDKACFQNSEHWNCAKKSKFSKASTSTLESKCNFENQLFREDQFSCL